MLKSTQVIALASELNHILWTSDTPTPDASIADEVYMVGGNMQCAAHAIVCAGLMLRRGEQMTTHGGSALVVYPEQAKYEKPHFVLKHWWITTSRGLYDLSLNLKAVSSHKPVIFQNTNLADPNWSVVFKDDFKRVLDLALQSHAAGICGVFYQTDKKLPVSKEALDADLLELFTPANKRGVPLRYLEIVLHCERFLNGGESVLRLPQEETWRHLAERA